jgi:hypothetical protein
MRRLLRAATLAAVLLVASAPALAQGCVMCSTGAHAAGEKAERSLLHGVVILLVPPVGMMVGLVGLAFYYRRES